MGCGVLVPTYYSVWGTPGDAGGAEVCSDWVLPNPEPCFSPTLSLPSHCHFHFTFLPFSFLSLALVPVLIVPFVLPFIIWLLTRVGRVSERFDWSKGQGCLGMGLYTQSRSLLVCYTDPITYISPDV